MSYQIFKPTAKKGPGMETISITRTGMNFSRATTRKYLNEISYVELYFDRDNKKIGIKPLSEKTENAYMLKGNKSKRVSAKDFLEFHKCTQSKTKRFVPIWNDQLKMLEIPL